MDLGISDKLKPVLAEVIEFIQTEVAPVEHEFFEEIDKGDRWTLTDRQTEIVETLKSKARAKNLWNFFIADEKFGGRFSTVEYAYLAEEMGKYHLAAEAFNCAAPDTGNMDVLMKYGSEDQKKQWLEPLLDGKIRSAFAMTEPDVASSDATNVRMSAVLDGDDWVINGEKFYISGAGDPRCKIMICMVVTEPDAPAHARQSQILVPIDTAGVDILRPMHVFSMDDAPHGHMHIRFTDVRVPKDNLILGRGRGFEISQGRLGPGRVHHCMRALGSAEKALAMFCERGVSRTAFGKPLANLGANFDIIANARIDIEMGRLLVLKTAHIIDTMGAKDAHVWISKIKVAIPNMAERIINEAIQMHGAAGISQDFPLAAMWMGTRTLRLADGPDAVHRRQVARRELRPYREAFEAK
jgi:acyl-CoA dehydrogenase